MTERIIGGAFAVLTVCVGFILNGFRLRIKDVDEKKASKEICLANHSYIALQYGEIKEELKKHDKKLDEIIRNGKL